MSLQRHLIFLKNTNLLLMKNIPVHKFILVLNKNELNWNAVLSVILI